MPVEIKELHLKFNIDNGSTATDAAGSTSKAEATGASCSNNDSASSHRLVQTTTDEVLRIIEAKREER